MSGAGPGRLHVLTDETLQSRFSHLELARMAADAGADTVQLREKRDWPLSDLLLTAREIRQAIARRATALIVNDWVDVALAAGAAGVHLGPADTDPLEAREILGRAATIGATVNDIEGAERMAHAPVTYVGVGPVFGTRSKTNPAPRLGLDGLRRIVRAVGLPVIAIGNITPERVDEVLQTGAHGIAVLSAVVCDRDPERRVAQFHEAIERSLAAGVGA